MGIRHVEKQDFDESLFENIGDFIASAGMVDLTGLGEPLLSSLFWKILDRYPVTETTTDDEFFLTFNTNGTLLTEQNIDNILRSRISKIRISIDAADEETFWKIRGTSLTDIVAGARQLIAKRNALHRSRPRVAIEMTIMKETIDKVPAMVDLCKEIGADFLEVWSLNALPPHMMKDWVVAKNNWTFSYLDQSLNSVPDPDLLKVVESYHRYADEQGVMVASIVGDIGKLSDNFPIETSIIVAIICDGSKKPRIVWRNQPHILWHDQSIKCDMPWQELRITYEGDVYACCWQPRPIGNIRSSTLESVWNGNAMHELRQELIAGKIPKLCSGAACSHVKGQSAPNLEPETAPLLEPKTAPMFEPETLPNPGPLARAWRAVSSALGELSG